MDGIGDILPALWQMLGGGAQTAQTPAAPVPAGRLGMVPATATGQPPTPAPATGVGGLGGLLANPATQGILSAYFGYLGRPRGLFTNRWQGLGQAGLAGLQGYSTAREQQLKVPLEQAQLQEAQARVPFTQAQTQELQQKMQLQKQMADQLENSPDFQKLNPYQKMAVRQGVLEGKMDPQMFGLTPAQQQDLELRKQEMKSLETERQATAEARKQTLELQKQREARESALTGPRIRETEARTKALGQLKPMTEAEMQHAADAEGKAAVAGWKKGWETETGFEARKQQAYQDAKNAALNRLRTENAARTSAATTGGASDLPEGTYEEPLTP